MSQGQCTRDRTCNLFSARLSLEGTGLGLQESEVPAPSLLKPTGATQTPSLKSNFENNAMLLEPYFTMFSFCKHPFCSLGELVRDSSDTSGPIAKPTLQGGKGDFLWNIDAKCARSCLCFNTHSDLCNSSNVFDKRLVLAHCLSLEVLRLKG